MSDLAQRLIAWQRQHGRHGLPWQGTRDPYRVWLSEVMLQQTQVQTVLDYYPRFLARFPDVAALASAPLDDVLALWSGLGYYSRARHLHRCAQQVMSHWGGAFPRRSADLVTLPGIGPSTAAAIAAFCFGERAAILDGNVKRVLSRVLGFDGDLAQPAQEKALWSVARSLLPQEDLATYTQGLMDLGATVCKVRHAACDRCPWQSPCVALAQGQPLAYPVKTRKLRRQATSSVVLWMRSGAEVLLVRRPDRGVWAGLWSLPEADETQAPALQRVSTSWPGVSQAWPSTLHVLTHRDWTLNPLRWDLPPDLPAPLKATLGEEVRAWCGAETAVWWPVDQALQLSLPAPVRRWLEL